MINTQFSSTDSLTTLIKSNGLTTWEDLIQYIQNLPYGRNLNRTDLGLVIREQKGSCSSKHALLKAIADLNSISNVTLILGIYKMNALNTPKIGDELSKYQLEYIPEAHCYLKINGERKDVTTTNSQFETLKKDILMELEIEPHQVAEFKVDYHKKFIIQWIKASKIPFDFESIWSIREQCIANLAS